MLSIGIDDYSPGSGFAPRSTCRNDAIGLADCFRDIRQLGADPDAVTTLVSRGTPAPSRGEIIGAVMRLAQSAAEGDRLIVFFSGRAHRIAGDPELYLVPQDAYVDSDPTCLVAWSQLEQILSRSPAAHRLLILDATGSARARSLDEPLRATTGAAILCASASSARSPDPQRSRFAAYLLSALHGSAPEALDDRRLTLPSLHRYLSGQLSRAPLLHEPGPGAIVLGDFSGPLLSPDALGHGGELFNRVELSGGARSLPIKQILTALTRTTYTQSYLEGQANAALGGYLEAELGAKVSRLRAQFRWASSEVSAEDGCITFPNGHYQPRYEASTRSHGSIVDALSLAPAWLHRPGAVADLLACLETGPERITFTLRTSVVPARCIPGLEAGGWHMTSELPHKIEAHRDGCALTLEPGSLTLSGLPLQALFAATPDEQAMRTAAAALAIFSAT